jgi:hypothetical protein
LRAFWASLKLWPIQLKCKLLVLIHVGDDRRSNLSIPSEHSTLAIGHAAQACGGARND